MAWDSRPQSRKLAEDSKPSTVGAHRKLRERVDELEKRLAALESHTPGYRADQTVARARDHQTTVPTT